MTSAAETAPAACDTKAVASEPDAAANLDHAADAPAANDADTAATESVGDSAAAVTATTTEVVEVPTADAEPAASDSKSEAAVAAETEAASTATSSGGAPKPEGAAEPASVAETAEAIESLLAQGRRDYYCGEYVKSVAALQRACEALAAKHGDLADEVAEPYLLYGRALLEVARMEADVLGGALDGVPAEERPAATSEKVDGDKVEDEKEEEDEAMIEKDALTEAEKERISEQVIDAMTGAGGEGEDSEMKEAGAEETKAATVAAETAGQKPAGDDGQAEGEAEGDEGEEGEEEGEGEDAEEAESVGEEEEEEEDVGNLQIAWEVLEVARKVFEHRGDWARVADCHMCLAEVGMEKEDWDQAEEDFTAACRVYTESAKLDKGDRRLATAQFQLAVACLAGKKFAEAKRAFDDSAAQLGARAAQLQGDATPEAEAERRELDDLIGELRQRMSEVDEERLDFEATRRQLRSGAANIAGTSPSAAAALAASAPAATPAAAAFEESAGSVNDISCLVRKKRPAPTASPTAAGATAAAAPAATDSDAVAPSPVKRRRTVVAVPASAVNGEVGESPPVLHPLANGGEGEGEEVNGDKAKLSEANGVESSAA